MNRFFVAAFTLLLLVGSDARPTRRIRTAPPTIRVRTAAPTTAPTVATPPPVAKTSPPTNSPIPVAPVAPVAPPPTSPTSTCTIFSLVDIATQSRVQDLCGGETIQLSKFSAGFTIVLNPAATLLNFNRIIYYVNGVKISDTYANYSLLGGLPYNGWTPAPGDYTIKAVLYIGLRLAHRSYSIDLHVIN